MVRQQMKGPEELVARAILDLVPQWYEADCGPVESTLQVGKRLFRFHSHGPVEGDWLKLLEYAKALLPSLLSLGETLTPIHLIEHLQDTMAVYWLKRKFEWVDWRSMLQYLSAASHRSYENRAVSANFVISRKLRGSISILDPTLPKIIDPLTSSPDLYLALDGSLCFVDLDQIDWAQKTKSSHQYQSQTLQDFWMHLNQEEVFVHLSQNGDFWFISNEGLIASRRRGKWSLYDVHTFVGVFCEVYEDVTLGRNLHTLALTLSYQRRGALLVYDPKGLMLQQITNLESVFGVNSDIARKVIETPMKRISLRQQLSYHERMLVLGAAGMDGAVIFSADQILAVGAMIRTHSAAGRFVGARTAAAASAYLHGGIPLKISSDGDMTLRFCSHGAHSECDARVSFL